MASPTNEDQKTSGEVSDSVEHVSDTAIWVATFRARESARPDGAFKDSLAAKLVGDRGERLVAAIPSAVEMEFAMVVRTTAIDRLVDACVRDGIDMVVNLGAGLDTRPYRMVLPSGLTWVEVDFPHLIEFKQRTLANESPRCRLERISADLSDDRVRRNLFATLANRTKKALIITEGVIPYLPNDVAATLARDLAVIPTFEYWIQDFRQGYANKARELQMSKALKQAPFLFDIGKPIPFFEACGWKLHDKIMILDEADRLGRKLPLAFPLDLVRKLLPGLVRRIANHTYGFALYARPK